MSHNILVIEDDANLRRALIMTLEDADYTVHGASSGQEALEVFRNHSQIDVVITDVRMAGMDGIQALEYMRKIRPAMRCVVITGFADEKVPGRAIQVGAEDYLYKPFDTKDLLRTVGRMGRDEADEASYLKMLGKVTSGYRSLLRGLKTAIASKGIAKAEAARHEAYQAYYVGVRSQRLVKQDANNVWNMLEQVDKEMEAARADANVGGVAEKYTYLKDLIAAVHQGKQTENAWRRDSMTAEDFGKFYKLIQSGELTLEQIKVATYVRAVDPMTRATSPDLLQLHQTLFR